jgi:hypothetical protein
MSGWSFVYCLIRAFESEDLPDRVGPPIKTIFIDIINCLFSTFKRLEILIKHKKNKFCHFFTFNFFEF